MHAAVIEFVRGCLERIEYPRRVVEIGGRDVNGSVAPLFALAERYVCVDLEPGPGVDVVADGETYQPEQAPDLVLCLEVLEHAWNARGIVLNAWRMLAPGGTLILTCAGPGRPEHSGVDGGPIRDGEYYRNPDPGVLLLWLTEPMAGLRPGQPACALGDLWLQLDPERHDIRLLAMKQAGPGPDQRGDG